MKKQRDRFVRVLVVCLCVIFKVTSSDYLENCKKTLVEENVTLKGGIGAGTFRILGKVMSMESCIELCCKTSTCDVAFLSASKCYGVECVSDEECKSTATDTSDVRVLIAHVRTGHKKDNTSLAFITPNFTSNVKPHPNGFLGPNRAGPPAENTPKGLIAPGQKSGNVNPTLAGECRAGKVFKEVTLKGGINAGTYKDVGSVQSMEECSNKCCEFAACDLAFMLSSRCYLVGCSEGKNCQIQKAKPSPYHPSVTYIERWNKEGVKHTDTKFSCPEIKTLTKVTLKGGLKAGDFTDTGKVGSIKECYATCCQQSSCNLAFMLGQNCFSVKCYNKDLCSTIPAQPSIFNPQIAYVWERKELKSDASRNKILKPQVVCPAGKVLESVTLVGGIQSGYFRDHGKVKDMLKCRRICCEMPHCNLAFMLSSNCFSVACKSAEACKTQSANPSRYNPKISYVREYGSNELIGAPKPKESEVKETIPGLSQTPFTQVGLPQMPHAPEQTTQTLGQKPEIPGLSTPLDDATKSTQFQQTQQQGLASLLPGQPQQPSPLNPLQPPASPFSPSPQMPGQQPDLSLPGIPLNNGPVMQMPNIPAPEPQETIQQGLNQLAGEQSEVKKTQIPQAQDDQSLKNQIQSATAGQAMKMNIVNGKLELTPVEGSNSSKGNSAAASESPASSESNPKSDKSHKQDCAKAKVLNNVTLKGGKKAGTFNNHGDVVRMDDCQRICCEDKKCNVAFMLGKTCYSVTCKTKDLCDHTKAPPTDYNPQLAYVRKMETPAEKETNEAPSIPPDPKDLKCKHSNITNNKDLPGGIHKNNFTEVKEAKNMASCMNKCCDNKDCDLAYMVQKKCYAVSCTKKEYCIPMTVKASKKSPLMSAMIMKVQSKVETDLSAVATPPEDSTEFASNSGTCSDSRISTDIKLRPGVFSNNFTNLGEANDIHRCISRCCIRPSCDIAYLLNNKCFAVQCLDGVMCQTNAEPAASGANVQLAYMNRGGNAPKERDWMIIYIVVASLAFVAGISGVIWAVCICTKKQKMRKQRRLIDDEEDDEMLPKPTQTRYRTPMPRY
ncbi:uncharacterized protein LOC141860552 isoform X2 [Acropora palmata]|uniref:uncharacterized protein LOC141860552 isoform X2 n=1 Tax=Acropora palmata TaxID=6131 RepID=UPI003DA17096